MQDGRISDAEKQKLMSLIEAAEREGR